MSFFKDTTIRTFFTLLQAGLWEYGNTNIQIDGTTDWQEVYRLATEQSVLGLVLAGLEHSEVKPPQALLLQWIGEVQALEQRNKAMNAFIEKVIGKLREHEVYTLIVKGQGVAQCYERPLWRASGDIDLYLNEDDFQRAKLYFRPLVSKFDPDNEHTKHINMHYGDWVVEIHANQNCSLSQRINRVMDDIHRDLFYKGNVRSWQNNGTQVFLPSANNDAVIIFTHFFNHFYKGGVGLRQLCDWCRLLWTYRETLDIRLLESRLRKAGLMAEWKVFGSYAVNYLGMPVEAMPFYDSSKKWIKKAKRINEFILEVGNFGHNRDISYYGKYPFVIRKAFSYGVRLKDWLRHARVFPLDSVRFLFGMTVSGFNAVLHGE